MPIFGWILEKFHELCKNIYTAYPNNGEGPGVVSGMQNKKNYNSFKKSKRVKDNEEHFLRLESHFLYMFVKEEQILGLHLKKNMYGKHPTNMADL